MNRGPQTIVSLIAESATALNSITPRNARLCPLTDRSWAEIPCRGNNSCRYSTRLFANAIYWYRIDKWPGALCSAATRSSRNVSPIAWRIARRDVMSLAFHVSESLKNDQGQAFDIFAIAIHWCNTRLRHLYVNYHKILSLILMIFFIIDFN